MAIDRDDEVLLAALEASVERVGALDVSPDAEVWRASAHALLMSARDALSELVRREDLEEIEAHDALGGLRAARARLNAAFSSATASLDIWLGEARLGDHAAPEADQVAHFLNQYHAGEFSSLRARAASSVASTAVELMNVVDASATHRSALELAISGLRSAREAAADEGAEAVTAYGDLVEGRSVARVCYLTARDLISACLRFDGRRGELDEVIAPICDLLKVGFS